MPHAQGAGRRHPCSWCSLRATQGVGVRERGVGGRADIPVLGSGQEGAGCGAEASRGVGDTGPWVKACGLPFGDYSPSFLTVSRGSLRRQKLHR